MLGSHDEALQERLSNLRGHTKHFSQIDIDGAIPAGYRIERGLEKLRVHGHYDIYGLIRQRSPKAPLEVATQCGYSRWPVTNSVGQEIVREDIVSMDP